RRSDRTLERRYHVAIRAAIGGAAFVLLGSAHSPFLAVVLLSSVAIGVYGFVGPFWALPSGFLTGFSAPAGIALIYSVGNRGGFVGPYTIGAISRTTEGFYTGLALSGAFMFAAAILVLLIPKINRRSKS